jgi:hypothetical protein
LSVKWASVNVGASTEKELGNYYGWGETSDKRTDTEEALKKLDLPWPQILDGQRIPATLYGVNAIPHLILFAPDGTILKRGLRGEAIYTAVATYLTKE